LVAHAHSVRSLHYRNSGFLHYAALRSERQIFGGAALLSIFERDQRIKVDDVSFALQSLFRTLARGGWNTEASLLKY
jgi:hypothetical protein